MLQSLESYQHSFPQTTYRSTRISNPMQTAANPLRGGKSPTAAMAAGWPDSQCCRPPPPQPLPGLPPLLSLQLPASAPLSLAASGPVWVRRTRVHVQAVC